jgi:hypothetical protein
MVRDVLRRSGVALEPGTPDHRVHSLLVAEAGKAGAVGRLMHKALDVAFGGIVRRVGAAAGEEALASLWDELCARGAIAAAYWAFLSHAHVPPALRVRVFGEVHMLSHFMGGHNRGDAKALWLAERNAERAAERLAKARRRAQETATARDRRIAALEAELGDTRRRLASTVARSARPAPAAAPPPATGHARRLLAARARLRLAEAENQRLRRLLDALAEWSPPSSPQVRATATTPAPAISRLPDSGDCDGCRLLYVGGRCAVIPHLRRHAAARNLDLLHHDGGDETTLHALEGLVGQADAVFCPIDCVSHQACLAAKRLCRRLEKPFVPLRSGGGACFLRAVDAWRRGSEGGRPSPP